MVLGTPSAVKFEQVPSTSAHAYSLKIRMRIAQVHWSLSNVHNVHNFHFVFRMSPLIYQYVMKNCLSFFEIKEKGFYELV